MFKFLIGLMFGVAIAIGVVYYLNINQAQINSKLLDSQKNRPFENSNTIILAPDTKIKEAGIVKKNESSLNYDFYQILPDKKNDNNSNVINEKKQKSNTLYIQVAAFNQIDLANELKVKLNLQGYDDVDIVQVNDQNKVFYRVVLGPYDDENETNQVRDELKSNGFETNLVISK
jgi:hypothetical protein